MLLYQASVLLLSAASLSVIPSTVAFEYRAPTPDELQKLKATAFRAAHHHYHHHHPHAHPYAAAKHYAQQLQRQQQAPPSSSAGVDEECLVFEDQFEQFNLKTWQHEITLSGGGNWEFQYYTNNRSNSFVENGVLYLKPTLTSMTVGEQAVTDDGKITLWSGQPSEDCTDNSNYGCDRSSGAVADGNYLNPIQSARIRTIDSVSLRYGRVEVRARMPIGDWLWPAIWMMPKYSSYGSWPASGEIDIAEGVGNRNFIANASTISSTLHWGPNAYLDEYLRTSESIVFDSGNRRNGTWADDFHTYGLEWTPNGIRTYVDTATILQVDFDQPAFERGEFDANTTMNPWKSGNLSAPFDQEFFLILNVAVGGTNGYFPDDKAKPWQNDNAHAMNQFYNARDTWLPTWGEGNRRALAIDWIRMWSFDKNDTRCRT
ncbi:concanavalin A-like lectin/glucanase domain-containing protein [Mycotypha africana]|uniref:concanavalin A-like lectin/glucanase domain-containing protein n=1 Tax=Mycotypha africana TaxID=64632 RepID=UPI002300B5AD|nr:concanavalin A-like lectin/glucanase domain-containing protein [Mycotypha africana]KAI8973645.1 concanavalin A-like lectin/glucanase domain-containing protein [Mycotypha africana]